MTDTSQHMVVVTAVGCAAVAGDGIGPPAPSLANAVGAVRSGACDRVTVKTGHGGEIEMQLEAEIPARRRGARILAELRGLALTETASGDADPDDLQPARAIRRALADGGMRAGEVEYASAETVGRADPQRELHAIERGLGRFAPAVVLDPGGLSVVRCVIAIAIGRPSSPLAFESDDSDIAALATSVRSRLATALAVSGAVALIINAAEGNLALAFGRPR